MEYPNQSAEQPVSSESGARPEPVKLIDFRDYADAQAAVDRLSDLGFPVGTVSIVWRGLRRVEQVTGRRTVLTAAGEGAIGGAWFGALIGLLFAALTDLPENTSVIGFTLTYLLVGALAGAAWTGLGHARRRGERDFSIVPIVDAESYELWVEADHSGRAVELLGLTTHRPQDPDGFMPDDQPTVGPAGTA